MHLSHSGLQQLLTCPASYFLSKKQGISLKKESTALQIGSAFHWGCEHNTDDLGGYLDELDPYQTNIANYQKEVTLASGMVYAYLNKKDELFKEILTDYNGVDILDLKEEFHELDITVPLKSFKYEADHEFHGIIDLLLLTNKGWIIIDYKTSSIKPDFDKYLDQVLRYAWMLRTKYPEVPVYKIGIINVRKVQLRKKDKENDENYLMRLKREYVINDDELVVYNQFSPDDFEESKMNLYIANLSRMADFAQMIEDSGSWYINYGNAVSVYGKSEFWDLFYKTQNCQYLYKIRDPMFNYTFNEMCEYRDCTMSDICALEIPNLLNHFVDFENFVMTLDSDIDFTKDVIKAKCKEQYTIDDEVFELYWTELNRKLEEAPNETENVSA